MTDYPHAQAAFINALRKEGTKKEACDRLQKTWNELCAVRAELRASKDAALEEAYHAMTAAALRALKEQP